MGQREVLLKKHPPAKRQVKSDGDNNILIDAKPLYPGGTYGTNLATRGQF